MDSFFANRLHPTSYEITPESPVIRYWIEPRATCPGMVFPDERSLGTRFKNEEKGSYPADVMRERIADGYCLLSEPATVANAGLIIFVRKLATENWDHIREIFRISAYEIRKNQLEELYRSTQILAQRYDPILLIGMFEEHGPPASMQLIGTYPKRTGSASLDALLTHTHVNLSIENVQRPNLRKNLKAILIDQTAKPADPRFVAAGTFLDQIVNKKSAKPEDADLIRFLI